MINFLHSFEPQPVIASVGKISLHWYGLFIVVGIIIAFLIALELGKKYKITKETIADLAFWLIIFGIVGARTYHVLLELPFYLDNLLNVFKIWQGGLAIHGGVFIGIITIYFFSKIKKLDPWLLSSIIVPGLALGQALGRWGNYFNQELFGKPTSLPWGIPIAYYNRPVEFFSFSFFHPTFLYESLGSLVIFSMLIWLHLYFIKRPRRLSHQIIVIFYLISYSSLRFIMEFIRIDYTPHLLGLRLPQTVSLIIIITSIFYLLMSKKSKKTRVLS